VSLQFGSFSFAATKFSEPFLFRTGGGRIESDDANTVNLKLFPRYPDPPQVADYDVPICITNVQDLVDKYWDLSMRRVSFRPPFIAAVATLAAPTLLPGSLYKLSLRLSVSLNPTMTVLVAPQILAHVDGVNYIKKIALKSDVDIRLVRKCIQHLLYVEFLTREAAVADVRVVIAFLIILHCIALIPVKALWMRYPHRYFPGELMWSDFLRSYKRQAFFLQLRRFPMLT
jgi:hypothetical protein